MKTKSVGSNLTGRLETGAAILAAAKMLDITLVKARLGAFASAQRNYVEAQRQVDAADAALREGQVRLARRVAEQDEAMERLAVALVAGGQPRAKPFTAFGTEPPSIIKQMPAAAKTKAIHQLVDAVQSQKSIGKAALHAAQAAAQAALRADAALLAVNKIQATLSSRRRARDDIGQTWKTTFMGLKLGARYDGPPGLYTALFQHPVHSRKKAVTPLPTPAPTPPAPTPPAVTEPTV
jgi:hypothetical protein